ncbi:MAG: 16S rRNA (cytidine(1402)-2'-O)-methyltransferase [Pseudomonadota bacterium]|nr:16S rRNA (cytidine(1402)-2'-O)-methyltransferase [Pseudomonadota bacterium]
MYIVATPLGNLADITYRAVQVLRDVDLIAAEDTRHSLPLLRYYGIDTPLISLHEHNEQARAVELTARLRAGESIAMISDAGTPLISDPGYRLVANARAAGLPVTPIPGPSAVIAALSTAGLPTNRFVFEGFLPPKAGARQRRLQELTAEMRTLVFYEASHRIAASLNAMRDVLGRERRAVVARELTKTFENSHGDTLAALCDWINAEAKRRRGEFVVVVEGASESPHRAPSLDIRRLLSVLLTELPVKTAARLAADVTGDKKNALYRLALKIASESSQHPA